MNRIPMSKFFFVGIHPGSADGAIFFSARTASEGCGPYISEAVKLPAGYVIG
jgi:hypothetical protein